MSFTNIITSSYVVRLRPLTVVHVWSGEEAVLGIDAVYRSDGSICIVDFNKLPKEFIDRVMRGEDVPNVVASLRDRLTCRYQVTPVVSPKPSARIKLPNVNIVPGSSIKGYIRTAVLYYEASKLSVNNLIEVLNRGVNLEVRHPKRVGEGVEANFFRKPRLRTQRGFVDSFQQLLVSDPTIENRELRLYEFEVYELPNMNKITSTYAIALCKGSLRYSLSILNVPNVDRIPSRVEDHKSIIETLSKLLSIDLLSILRFFGCKLLELEMERIEKIRELEKYLELLKEFQRRYCSGKGECVIARIGFMTGHQVKTILPLIKQVYPQLYIRIIGYLSKHYGHPWDEKTLKLVRLKDGRLVGIGWCELCFEKVM